VTFEEYVIVTGAWLQVINLVWFYCAMDDMYHNTLAAMRTIERH
jgi:hypothetical protein